MGNGFFMSMRAKYTKPGSEIYFFSVEWDPAVLAWADFRNKVLGPTDPAAAPADSLRGTILKDWEALGLKAAPNTGALKDDTFGKQLLDAGMSEAMIKDWSVDPQVNTCPIRSPCGALL